MKLLPLQEAKIKAVNDGLDSSIQFPCRLIVTRPNPTLGLSAFKGNYTIEGTSISAIPWLLCKVGDSVLTNCTRALIVDAIPDISTIFEHIILTNNTVNLDIIKGYSLDKDNNFGIKQCTITIANPQGIYSPERLDQNTNYYWNNPVNGYQPLFNINNKILIEEAIIGTDNSLQWIPVFTGFIENVTPSVNEGFADLKITCLDTLCLAKDSVTERFYQPKLLRSGDDAVYYENGVYFYEKALDFNNPALWITMSTTDNQFYRIDPDNAVLLTDFPSPIFCYDIIYQKAKLIAWNQADFIPPLMVAVLLEPYGMPIDDSDITLGSLYMVQAFTSIIDVNKMIIIVGRWTGGSFQPENEYTVYGNNGQKEIFVNGTDGKTAMTLKVAWINPHNIAIRYYCTFRCEPAKIKTKYITPTMEDSFNILYNIGGIQFTKMDITRSKVQIQYFYKDMANSDYMDIAQLVKDILIKDVGFLAENIKLPINNMTGILLDTIKFTKEQFPSSFDCIQAIINQGQAPPNLKLRALDTGEIEIKWALQKCRPTINFSKEMVDCKVTSESQRVYYSVSIIYGGLESRIGNEVGVDAQLVSLSPNCFTVNKVIPNIDENINFYRIYKRYWDSTELIWKWWYCQIPIVDIGGGNYFTVYDLLYGIATPPIFEIPPNSYTAQLDMPLDAQFSYPPYPDELLIGYDHKLMLKRSMTRNLLKSEVYTDVTAQGVYATNTITEYVSIAYDNNKIWVNDNFTEKLSFNWITTPFDFGRNRSYNIKYPIKPFSEKPPEFYETYYTLGMVSGQLWYQPDTWTSYNYLSIPFDLIVIAFNEPIKLGQLWLIISLGIWNLDVVYKKMRYGVTIEPTFVPITYLPTQGAVVNAAISLYVSTAPVTQANIDTTTWIQTITHYPVKTNEAAWVEITTKDWGAYLPDNIYAIKIRVNQILPEIYKATKEGVLKKLKDENAATMDVYNFALSALRIYPEEKFKVTAQLWTDYNVNKFNPEFVPMNTNKFLLNTLQHKELIMQEDINLTNKRLAQVRAKEILREVSRYATATSVDIIEPAYLDLNDTVLVTEQQLLNTIKKIMMIDKLTINRDGYNITGNVSLIEY